jgi:hypothetical protein
MRFIVISANAGIALPLYGSILWCGCGIFPLHATREDNIIKNNNHKHTSGPYLQ